MLEKKKLPHTILLHGPSGTGKTTISRILKKELGCSDGDFTEVNCSDDRGIETIREITNSMRLAPMGGKCKVYYLDECHMMNKYGQNAALKMLEDTPKHVYFILSTTDPHRLIPTIRNRCTELPVKPLTDQETKKLLCRVAKAEGIVLHEETQRAIADSSNGSARKALVLLDKIQNLPPREMLKALETVSDEDDKSKGLAAILMNPQSQWSQVAKCLKELKGEDVEGLRRGILGYASAVVLNSPKHPRAMNALLACEEPMWDAGLPGLVRACWEIVFEN
jgi:DNA polymerase III gamma/tau subunit